MTPLYDNQEFYKKMSELQERLRKSEDERMKLEERFNILSQDSRSRREACINNLRMRYIDFLEEQRLRDERNHQILGSLDKIDGSLARMTARTDRLGILRKQYEAYLLRVYANRSTGGGTGDSGVGSHNDGRSPKSKIMQTEKKPPSVHRIVMQNTAIPLTSISQTNYPHSNADGTNGSFLNQRRYTQGQETPQVHVMQADGQGDGSTIMQPHRMVQHFHGSKNLNIPHNAASETNQIPNASQNRNGPQRFLRPNNPLVPNSGHVHHRQLDDIFNSQYLEHSRLSYPGDPSAMASRSFLKFQEFISSDIQTSELQPDRANVRPGVDLSADLTEEGFGPYRHSTPLPGYLDYSTRYSRDPSVYEPNVGFHYGFTRNDYEKVIQKNEQILPRDYLLNPGTLRPTMHTSKLSALPEDKQRGSDIQLNRAMNDDELDQYIQRIRSLHRDNDQSLEGLDAEQNTSGDLLNATLSDDAPDQPTLHSDDKIKPSTNKIISDDVKSVLALASDFAVETTNLDDESQVKNDSSSDRKIPAKSGFNWDICKEDNVAKPTLVKSIDPSLAALNADMTSDNLSISATRGDIVSRTPSVGVNQIRDISETSNSKFRSKVMPLVKDLDTSWLNSTGAVTASQNNPVDPSELLPNTCGDNKVLNFTENTFIPDRKIISDEQTRTDLGNSIQSIMKNNDAVPKITEVYEDIEGDKVRLIKRDPEQVIDSVRELQPPSLQHYEKNVVEIRVGNGDKNDTINRKVVHEDFSGSEIRNNEDKAKEALSQDPIANKTFSVPKEERNKDVQSQDDTEPKYQPNPDDEHPVTYEHQSHQKLIQDIDENRNDSQRLEQNSDADYDSRQTDDEDNHLVQPYVPTPDEPYSSHGTYHANQQYEADPNQVYAQKPNPEFAYDPNQHFADDRNPQYAAGSNEQYGVDPNEKYTTDPNQEYVTGLNKQYAANPNEHYATDPNEHYIANPNEHYVDGPNGRYPPDSNEQYATEPNEHYVADPNEYYVADPNGQYPPDSNEHYAVDPNEQYGYYENQPYQNDPNAPYPNTGNEHYNYDADPSYQEDPNHQFEHDPNQQYEHDPNQQFEHDPNQQYELDPNQQYEHDPNQQFEHDPNQQYELDPNQQYEHVPNEQYELDPNQHDPNEFLAHPTQEYKEHEYEQNQNYESVGYEEPKQGDNQQFENDLQQDYAGRNVEMASSNQDYPTAAVDEQNQMQLTTGDSYIEELSNPDVNQAEDYSTKEKKKNKDVIKALLESDTESTIERNPSNNTESDFDFN